MGVNFYSLKIPAAFQQPGYCLEQPNQEEDVDGNYYDGSKPKNTMELVTWFDKDW